MGNQFNKYCNESHKNNTVAYCHLCETLLCSSCIQYHQDHSESVKSHKLNFYKAIGEYTDVQEQAQYLIKQIDSNVCSPSIEELKESIVQKINPVFDELISLIQTARESVLKAILYEGSLNLIGVFQKQKSKAIKQKESIQKLIQDIREIINKLEQGQTLGNYIPNYQFASKSHIKQFQDKLHNIQREQLTSLVQLTNRVNITNKIHNFNISDYISFEFNKVKEIEILPFNISEKQILHYFKPGTAELHLYDVISKKHKKINIPKSPAKDQYYYASIQMLSKLYICGGSKLRGETYEYSLNNQSFIQKSNMKYPVWLHALAVARRNIYSIGGYDGCSWVDSVEKINPDKNKWISCPSINEKKCVVSAVTISDKYLVAVGGWDGSESHSTIEVFDSSPENHSWEILHLNGMNDWTARYASVSLVTPENEVLIFGGYNSEGTSADIFKLNVSEKTIKKLECKLKLKTNQVYTRQSGLFISGMGFMIMDDECVHWFSEYDSSANLIRSQEWMK